MSMRSPNKIPAAIAEQAVGWFVRRDAGALSAAEQAQFDAWLHAAPAHATAYSQIEQDWSALADVGEPARRRLVMSAFVLPAQAGTSRRFGIAAAAAILLLGASLWLSGVANVMLADHRTAAGERRVVALDDGSRVDLNTDTALDVSFDGGQRRIRLLRGEAVFHVMPDPARPFAVVAGQGSVTALGTVFAVRRVGDDVQVAAIEHRIEVAAGGQSRVLQAGEGMSYTAAGLGGVQPVDAAMVASWRFGKLVFEQRALGEVVAELGRYRSGLLYLQGEGLADRPVSGVIDLEQIEPAIDHMARSLGLTVRHYGGLLTILQR